MRVPRPCPRLAVTLLLCATGSGCGSDKILVGVQCPSPYTDNASYAPGVDLGVPIYFFGTSCAPCDGEPLELDDQGCPIYVTPQSCGGNVCLLGAELRTPSDMDDGGVEEDAGDDDSGAPDVDAGGGQ